MTMECRKYLAQEIKTFISEKTANTLFSLKIKHITEVCHFIEQKKTSKSNFSDGEIFFDV